MKKLAIVLWDTPSGAPLAPSLRGCPKPPPYGGAKKKLQSHFNHNSASSLGSTSRPHKPSNRARSGFTQVFLNNITRSRVCSSAPHPPNCGIFGVVVSRCVLVRSTMLQTVAQKLKVPKPFLASEKLTKTGVTHLCLHSYFCVAW